MERASFKDLLLRFEDLNDADFEQFVLPYLQIRRFGKKQIISEAGEVENYMNLISKGLVRKYFTKDKMEHNVQISRERQIVLNLESFYDRKPAEYTIEAIEPTVLISVSHADMELVFSHSHLLEHVARKLLTYSMVSTNNWYMQLIRTNPRERFLNFVTRNPELLQRVPQKYLASYLNIKPETFSRFKHLLRNYSPAVMA
jgi:CRP-like cAMP-binding protein